MKITVSQITLIHYRVLYHKSELIELSRMYQLHYMHPNKIVVEHYHFSTPLMGQSQHIPNAELATKQALLERMCFHFTLSTHFNAVVLQAYTCTRT